MVVVIGFTDDKESVGCILALCSVDSLVAEASCCGEASLHKYDDACHRETECHRYTLPWRDGATTSPSHLPDTTSHHVAAWYRSGFMSHGLWPIPSADTRTYQRSDMVGCFTWSLVYWTRLGRNAAMFTTDVPSAGDVDRTWSGFGDSLECHTASIFGQLYFGELNESDATKLASEVLP